MNELDVQESKHALAGIAEILYHYMNSLTEHGFSRDEAFRLVVQYQVSLLRKDDPDA